jgi:type VI secretion system protein ImpK
MSKDDSDKTVFRQSGGVHTGRADSTVIRPSPGRRSGQHPQHRPADPAQQIRTNDAPAGYPSQRSFDDANAGQVSTIYGLNPLVNAASMLLAVFHKTRQSVSHPNVGGLHQQLVAAIRSFETNAKERNIRPEIVLAARYILCTALDEAVLNTPWGAESAWTQRSLLSIFHNESNGGEKFFLLVDRMRERPAENLEILELMYILLSLGFEGRYRVISRGRDLIENIRDELYRIIRTHRGDYERQLSANWHGLGRIKNSLANYIPMWVVASLVCGVLVLSYSGFRYWLYQSTEHVASQLEQIATAEADKSTGQK